MTLGNKERARLQARVDQAWEKARATAGLMAGLEAKFSATAAAARVGGTVGMNYSPPEMIVAAEIFQLVADELALRFQGAPPIANKTEQEGDAGWPVT